MASEEAAKLLKRFFALQEERVQTYKLFDQGHAAYLQSAPSYNFPMYRQLVHEVTQAFKRISDEIIDIQQKMKSEYKRPEVAKFMEKVQKDEQQKLEHTAKLQLAMENLKDSPEDASFKEETKLLKQRLRDRIERINEHLEELKYEAEDLLCV